MKSRTNKEDYETFGKIIEEYNNVIDDYRLDNSLYPTGMDMGNAFRAIFKKYNWTEEEFEDFNLQLKR